MASCGLRFTKDSEGSLLDEEFLQTLSVHDREQLYTEWIFKIKELLTDLEIYEKLPEDRQSLYENTRLNLKDTV